MLSNWLIMATGDFNLTALPSLLQDRLMLPNEYSSGIVATILLFIILVLPCLYFGNFAVAIWVSQLCLIFATVLGWLSTWVLLIYCLLLASMFAYGLLDKMTGG